MFAEKRQKQQPSLAGWGFRPVGVGSPAEQVEVWGFLFVGEYMLPQQKGVVLVLYNPPPPPPVFFIFLSRSEHVFNPVFLILTFLGMVVRLKKKVFFR